MARPLPNPSKISAPFWESCRREAMALQRCGACGVYLYYPVYICPECASRALEWTPVSGRGTIFSFTIASRATFDVTEPLVVALVELTEGAVMMSNIIGAAADEIAIGVPVKVSYRSFSENITLPLFELDR